MAFAFIGMTLDNASLFALMAAGREGSPVARALAGAFADWMVWSLPPVTLFAWNSGDLRLRVDLLCILIALVAACGMAAVTAAGFCGDYSAGCGFEMDIYGTQIIVWWTIGLSLIWVGRFAWMCFPLLAIGLAVGWSQIYLGRALPLHVLLAMPIAMAAAVVTWSLQRVFRPVLHRWIRRWGKFDGGRKS